jgi:hypothetical protein
MKIEIEIENRFIAPAFGHSSGGSDASLLSRGGRWKSESIALFTEETRLECLHK